MKVSDVRIRKARSLLFMLLLVFSTTPLGASPVTGLEAVGSATLKWMLWTVYDSTLYTPDGRYRGIEPGLTLEIDYRRDISARRLLETTRDQWQEMALYDPQVSESWLTRLAGLWPDIRRGDRITLQVEADLGSSFYHNGVLLGRLSEPDFTRQFLAIWLAENSNFPRLRAQLIGQS